MATSETKFLDIYFDGSSQRVKYYPGTPKEQLIELILTLFNKLPVSVKDGDSLKQIVGRCVFHDSDGDPVVFSPDVLPSGTKFFLRIQPLSKAVLNVAAVPNIPWHWDALINSHPNISYSLSENNTCAQDPSPDAKGYFIMPILCANRSITSGRHAWRCSFSGESAYRGFGLISKEEHEMLKKKDFGSDFTQFPLFNKFFSLDGSSSIELVMRLDMTARICTIETKGTDRQTYQVADLPEEVWPAFVTKRHHGTVVRVFFDV